jgi:hypothetical protein
MADPSQLNARSTKINLVVGDKFFRDINCDILMNERGGKKNFLKTMATLHLQNGMKPGELMQDAYAIKDIDSESFGLILSFLESGIIPNSSFEARQHLRKSAVR